MTEDDAERRRREEDERRRRRREDRADAATDGADAAVSSGCSMPGCGGGGSRVSGRSRGGDGCNACDACDFLLLSLRVSALLHALAAVMPRRRGVAPVVAVIRGYQRLLSRFTPDCPQNPSCSAHALAAVRTLGPREGIRAAAARVRACGQDPAS